MEIGKKETAPEVPVQEQLLNPDEISINAADFEKLIALIGVIIRPMDFTKKFKIELNYDPENPRVKMKYFKSEKYESEEMNLEKDKREAFYNNMDEIAAGYTEILKNKINNAKEECSNDEMKEINENIKIVNFIAGTMLRIKDLTDEKSGMKINNFYTNYGD